VAASRRRARRALLLGAGVGLIGLGCSLAPPVLELDESIGLAALFTARGPQPPPADIAVVSISRDSATAVGQTPNLGEWPRTLHADLIEALAKAGAAAIVFDVLFERPREPKDDARLAAAVRSAGNVVLLEGVRSDDRSDASGAVRAVVEQRIPPLPELKDGALATAPFTLPVVPIRVGQFWTFGRGADGTASLPAVAVQAYLRDELPAFEALLLRLRPALAAPLQAAAESPELQSRMRALRGILQADPAIVGEARAALDRTAPDAAALVVMLDLYGGPNSRYLNYYGPPRTIRTLSYDRVIREPRELEVAGKTVFVGFSEPRQPEQRDAFYSVFSQRSGVNLSGVEIGATAFANLLERRSIAPLAMPLHLGLVVLWGFCIGAALACFSAGRATALALLAAAAYCAVVWLAFESSVWLPALVPLGVQIPAALIALAVLQQRDLAAERTRIRTALGYYVPASMVGKLAEQSMSVESDRALLHGTCLFTDAEHYTTVSEALRPDELAALINAYFAALFSVVERYGGFVSDTSGDSMVAVWTTALPDPASRASACAAAVELLRAVDDFNRDRGNLRLPTRVGLESGEVLLGNVGASQRFGYRAIGDIVNTAARIQGLNAQLGTRLLVSGDTLLGVAGCAARDLGRFVLRGKTTAVRVHEPLATLPRDWDVERLIGLFSTALREFEAQRWSAAEQAFDAVLQRYPSDGPSAYYRDVSRRHAIDPPRHWAGAISVLTK
jgi:adenylate cyclase